MIIRDVMNEKELPNILIKQIGEKVEPFVLEDTKLKETDIEKIPKESELHNQLVKLVQLRSSLAIIPFVVMPRQKYISKLYNISKEYERIVEKIPKESELHNQLVKLVQLRSSLAIIPFVVMPRQKYISKLYNISKEYERIVSKINVDYRPPLIQDEELALDLFMSFTLEPMQNIESEELDSWLKELLSISEVLILINKINRLAIIRDESILDKEDIQKQIFFHIYCNCYELFTDMNILLKNRISDNAIFGSSPSFSFALRELVDNYINFSYLLKNPEDCQRMFDYLKYYGVYVRTQNSAVTLRLKKDFLLKYILSEKTKDQIQKDEKSIYSVVNKTRIDRWTLKSQEELLSEGAYNDQDKVGTISILKEIHSIIGHGDFLQDNNLKDLKQEKILSFVHLTLSIQVYLNVTYDFLSLIDVLDYNNDLVNIQKTLDRYREYLQNLHNL